MATGKALDGKPYVANGSVSLRSVQQRRFDEFRVSRGVLSESMMMRRKLLGTMDVV